jgi:hypothetical protein
VPRSTPPPPRSASGRTASRPGRAADRPPEPAPPAEWTPTERGLWEAFRRGELYDLRTGDPARDDPFGAPEVPETTGAVTGADADGAADAAPEPVPAEHGEWGAERSVRAEVLAHLLLSGPPPVPGRVASLKLVGARVTGHLTLAGGNVTTYVEITGCRFDAWVLLAECRCASLRVVRCAIPRLEARRLQTTGDLQLTQCRVPNGVRLADAAIGTDLVLRQLVTGPDRHGRALAADGVQVTRDVEGAQLRADGEVTLRSARIGGRLSLRGATLRNPGGAYALNAARLEVGHTLYLSAGHTEPDTARGPAGPDAAPSPAAPETSPSRRFHCEGGVRLDDGRFGNAVIINNADFVLTGDQQLSLRRARTHELRLTLDAAPRGRISLAGTTVDNLVDARTSWPGAAGPGSVDLEGFGYGSVTGRGPFTLRDRIAWLAAATPEYSPGPYEQLAAALRAGGEDADAREVLLAKQRRRRETLPPAGKAWGYLQDVTVGYGYRPGRAAIWMALLWAFGALYFSGHPAPVSADSGAHPHWSPPLFALDLLLPVIDLGQENAWRLSGTAQWTAALLSILGWVLATSVATGASRLLRRT